MKRLTGINTLSSRIIVMKKYNDILFYAEVN